MSPGIGKTCSRRISDVRQILTNSRLHTTTFRQYPSQYGLQDAAVLVVVDFDGGVNAALHHDFAGFAVLVGEFDGYVLAGFQVFGQDEVEGFFSGNV